MYVPCNNRGRDRMPEMGQPAYTTQEGNSGQARATATTEVPAALVTASRAEPTCCLPTGWSRSHCSRIFERYLYPRSLVFVDRQVGDGLAHRGSRGEAPAWILCHRPDDQLAPGGWEIGNEPARWNGRIVEMVGS